MKAKKVFGKIIDVLSIILIVIEIIIIVWVAFFKPNGKPTSVFGYSVAYVATGSMEPNIKIGDLILSKEYHGEELKVGDVVTYQGTDKTITHRVIEVTPSGVVIKGDANNAPDNNGNPIDTSLIISKYVCTLNVFGAIYRFIQNPIGFVVVIILPMALLIGYEIISGLVRNKLSESAEGDGENKE